MPISCELDAERRVVRCVAKGRIEAPDVLAHVDLLRSRGWFHYPRIMDANEATAMRAIEVRTLVERLHDLQPAETSGPIAIVASNDGVYGMGRMYSLLCETIGTAVEVFREEPPALEWLAAHSLCHQ